MEHSIPSTNVFPEYKPAEIIKCERKSPLIIQNTNN